jgi:hypothetical protein
MVCEQPDKEEGDGAFSYRLATLHSTVHATFVTARELRMGLLVMRCRALLVLTGRSMPVLTPEEYALWVQRLRLSPETDGMITTIRSSPPVRRVASRVGNVPGTYPSVKMGGRSMQFESHHVELWALYLMERDPDVLEFYDQPSRIPLTYAALSGRDTTQWHTPDFFVLHPFRRGGKNGSPKRPW